MRMNRPCWGLLLFALVGWIQVAQGSDLPPADVSFPLAVATPVPSAQVGGSSLPLAVVLPDPFTEVNGKNAEDDSKESQRPRQPQHTRDNAFLVEEAYNQEPGVVQHIFNIINQWDRVPGVRTRDFLASYTMELPLGSQTHQFSFTAQLLSSFEKTDAGAVAQPGGIGDTFLNYRYQLLADDDFLWCAPRWTLIVPTGDERLGLGTGQVGYQFNLPISRYGEYFDCHFNIGATLIPRVSAVLDDGTRSPRHDLRAYNLGYSVFWKPRTDLHLFVEALALWNEEIHEEGFRHNITQVFLNPGFRWVIAQFEDVEWVLGASVPVGLTRDSPDIGLFLYMSVEHTFRKVGGEAE